MLTVGSLFSGIGGLELGLEATGGFKTIWQCEVNDYASAVLRKHWPTVPNLGDITKVEWDKVEKPDIICGGFPCQDISNAGKKAGIKEGTRSGLWFEFHKAICALRPRYALIENVSAITNNGLHIVLAGLAEAGYNAEWFTLQAAEVGAPHRRERLFIVGYSNYDGFATAKVSKGFGEGSDDYTQRQKQACKLTRPSEQYANVADSDSGRLEGAEAEGWQCVNAIGSDRARSQAAISNSPSQRLYKQENQQEMESQGRRELLIRQSRVKGDLADSKGTRLPGGIIRQAQEQSRRSYTRNTQHGEWWAVEPDVGRVANGVPFRVDRIKCLGNAVVPQVAQVIGEAIIEVEGIKC